MRAFSLGLVIAALGVSTVDTRWAQAPPQATAGPPLTPGQAVVVGRVVEAGTTNGVPNAAVRLTGAALGAATATFPDGTPGGPRRVIADGDGRFVLRGLPAASYSLSASAAGYADSVYGQARPPAAPRRALDVVRTLDVTDADRPFTITVPMWRLGGLSGVVRDEAGEPMAGVSVAVMLRLPDASGPSLARIASVTTDDRGMYHVDVVPGDYQVAFFAPTTTVPVSASDAFQQAMREGGDAQRAYMTEIIAAGALLPRAYGTRMGDLLISRFDDSNRPVMPPFTDAAGRMFFYPTTFHPANPAGSAAVVAVASGEEKAGINLDLMPVPLRRVSGRVIGPNGPMTGFVVRLVTADPAAARSGPSPMDTSLAMTDGRGDFTFVAVAPGVYTLAANRMAASAADPALWAVDSVSVGETDVSGVDMTLQTGARVSGRVAVEKSGPALTPSEMSSITISVRPVGGAAALQPTPLPATRPDQNGRFTIPQIVPGPYILTLPNRVPAGLTVKSIVSAGRNAIDTPFDLTSSGADDVLITLMDRITTLTGTARDDAGQPSSTATVLVFPTDKALWPRLVSGSRLLRTAASGRDGRFNVRELPAGEYFVIATDGAARDFADPQVLATLTAMASRVTLADGDTKPQDLRVTVLK